MRRLFSGALGVLLTVSASFAAYIDFTDEEFSNIDSENPYYSEQYGITLHASPERSELVWDSEHGIGIDRPGRLFDNSNEIDYPEKLTISFDETTYLSSVSVNNLNHESFWFLSWDEEVGYTLSSGENGNFSAINDDGTLTFDIGESVDYITLYPGGCPERLVSEFTVAGIDIASVPEPATLSLLGAAMLSLFGMARIKKRR
ncbi:MAG: PEP-CTERM sorting domain-containing protein [Chitinispirillaceae bacterium]